MTTPWLQFTATLSGDQGPIMKIDQRLPMCLWVEARALANKADQLVKVYDMTQAGHTRKDIADAVGHSPGWVKERQQELGLI